MTSGEVREDDLNKSLAELEERDFLDELPPEVVEFIKKFTHAFNDESIYFRKSLIIDATNYMNGARTDLEEFSGLAFAKTIENVFDKYNDLLLFLKAERDRSVRNIKDLIKLLVLLERERDEGEKEVVNSDGQS